MWLYIIGGILLVIVLIILYLMYRGYNKIKPKPILGIPCPPLSHQMLGHPDKMMHPLKHELRLEVTEQARSPVHQVIYINIYFNDYNYTEQYTIRLINIQILCYSLLL